MTVKEKANQLVNNFYQLRAYETMADVGKKLCWNLAKESASICIDEITQGIADCDCYGGIKDITKFAYWNEVKQELEKL